jgi:hypothetical protein
VTSRLGSPAVASSSSEARPPSSSIRYANEDPLGTVLGGHRPGLKRSKVPVPSLLGSRQFGARRGKLFGNVRLAFRPPSGRLSQSAADKIGLAVGLMA